MFPLFLFCLEKEINDKCNIFCQRADEELHRVAWEAAVIVTECLPGTVLGIFLSPAKQVGGRVSHSFTFIPDSYPTFHMLSLSNLLRVGVRVANLLKQYYTLCEETVGRQGLK